MTTRHYARLLGLILSDLQLYACEYLESRGLRFCVDFGSENCEALATNRWLDAFDA
jgi:hypothetical protein